MISDKAEMASMEKVGNAARKEQPYIPAEQDLPQFTVKTVVLGVLLSAILAGANGYLGLKVGMTVSASIPAAVISMALLKLWRNSNILENNLVQTAASAGESLAAGVIFTLPALILLEYWEDFYFAETFAIALCGGLLGVLFTIPLRRALILESDLTFPEGVATAEVLKAGNAGGDQVRQILFSGLAAALYKVGQTGLKIFAGSIGGGITVNGSIIGLGTELSVALLAVGNIVGLNIASLVFAGGLISFVFAIPIWMATVDESELDEVLRAGLEAGDPTPTGYGAAIKIWAERVRFLGVGAMIVGGIWALISLAKPLVAGVRASLKAMRDMRLHGTGSLPRTEVDVPITYVALGVLLLAVPVFLCFIFIIDLEDLGVSGASYWGSMVFAVVFSLVAGFLFSSVAGYMAGLVGSSNNPISGVTIATVLFASLCLLGFYGTAEGARAATAASAAIVVGGMVACAAALAGDNLQDLKAGTILGATPWKQQIMQMVGVTAAALVLAPVVSLLFNAYGLGDVRPRDDMNPDEMLSAPQATLMKTVAEGVFSQSLQWAMIGAGGAIAVAIILADLVLEHFRSRFRMPVLAVAVGIYLPLELAVPIFLGGLVDFITVQLARRRAVRNGTDPAVAVENAKGRGLLFSSGLITGEALVGIILAIPFAAFQSTDVLSVWSKDAGDERALVPPILGTIVALVFVVWLFITSLGKAERAPYTATAATPAAEQPTEPGAEGENETDVPVQQHGEESSEGAEGGKEDSATKAAAAAVDAAGERGLEYFLTV
ncbi:unnamed protein product [Vitrella brassicaformis CCMP3155]|uniref:Oligopeptide transporter, OPT family n=2 Tax=Vitrella brassicaformis TaxID=1169539 RepID=A0A0G4FXD8_VITBC|nr:unnamed protein product [Vitrella brassicaformis CCMP3155]|eukprot:CEM19661.1 unnamed protein product [Vitrella brassicaformis CCMP3155]